MRCQRVHSYLPAYCRDELSGREVLTVREHLATCATCRNEEVTLRALAASARELSQSPISADFNTRLLNRIAQERFAETRTKAYLPKPAPRVLWRRVVPVVAGAMIVAIVAVGSLVPSRNTLPAFSSGTASLDDSYMTVQPDDNPNMTVNLKNWSLKSQLAKHERMTRISGMLTSPSGFTNVLSRTTPDWSGTGVQIYQFDLLRNQPVIRVYQSANSTQVAEGQAIY